MSESMIIAMIGAGGAVLAAVVTAVITMAHRTHPTPPLPKPAANGLPRPTKGTAPTCVHCERGVQAVGHRRCPICGQEFAHGTWGGMDAHWKRYHADVMSYDQYRNSLCRTHREWRSADPDAALAPRSKAGGGP